MKIICIGRNYAAHAKELGNEIPDEPLFFLKPETAVLPAGSAFQIPSFSQDVHFETELVLRIGAGGKDIPLDSATDHIKEFTLGLDMTARDVQSRLKKKGQPWEKAKAFDGSAILSSKWLPWSDFDPHKTRFELQVDGRTAQVGDPSLMLFPIPALLHHVSRYMTLSEGDLIFTGTPQGVGPVVSGNRLEAFLNGEGLLDVTIE